MFTDTLFRKNLIREQDRQTLVEMTAWLIRKYGAPTAPKVPSPLHRSPRIDDIVFSGKEERHLNDWAKDNFHHIKMECGREDWSVGIHSASIGNTHLKHVPCTQYWSLNAGDPYRMDEKGNPIIIFDPEECRTPGAFALRVILKLSEIQLMDFRPERPVDPILKTIMILGSAAYLGQGFNLVALADNLPETFKSRDKQISVSTRLVQNSLISSSCLNLMALNRLPEQIIATYGKLIPQNSRKKINQACSQIKTADTDLDILKLCISETASGNNFTPQRRQHSKLQQRIKSFA